MKTPEELMNDFGIEPSKDSKIAMLMRAYHLQFEGECEWTILSMNIGTECGEMTERNDDSDDYKYCPYCGKQIKRV